MKNNKVEELINTINPNLIQCPKCKDWIEVGEQTSQHGQFKDWCISCWLEKITKSKHK